MSPERTYTTHDIARFCDVYPSSVNNWISSGKLKAYQTGGGHHRVTRQDLMAFLEDRHVPIPPELAASGVKTILIVDDDEEMARVMQKAFARHPKLFRTELCRDGVEALIRIGQEPPDLVILDVVLPKMDGVQVCRVLKSRAETRDIKIIAVSGKKLPFSERKLEEAKVDAFFRKPMDLGALLAATAGLLHVELGRK